MNRAQAVATHTHEFTIDSRGSRLEVTDEASDFDRWGAPTGWVLFIEVQGEQMTAEELREIADTMDTAARRSGRRERHDV